MKNQKGISMIEVVIILIIILLIASFSIYSGRDAVNQASALEVYSEINAVKQMINSVNIKRDIDEEFILEQGKQYDMKVSDFASSEESFENAYNTVVDYGEFEQLYVIYGMDDMDKYESSSVKDFYGLDSIKHSYIINFDTGRVELLNSMNIANRSVKTYEQIRALIETGEI